MIENISIILNTELCNKTKFILLSKLAFLREKAELYSNYVYLSKITKSHYLRDEIQHQSEQSVKASKIYESMNIIASIIDFKCDDLYLTYNYTYIYDIVSHIVTTYNLHNKDKIILPKLANGDLSVVGLDGNARISNIFNNELELSLGEKDIKKKVMSIYTDPKHIKVSDPGHVEGNPLFIYVRQLCSDEVVRSHLGFDSVADLEDRYERGGVGDKLIKEMLFDTIKSLVKPLNHKIQSKFLN